MKKIIIIGMFIMSVMSYASWWGQLSNGSRAAIIGASAIILNQEYQDSEIKHQRDLDRLDTEIRREYERQAVIENAHRKYNESGVPLRLEKSTINNYSSKNYSQNQQYVKTSSKKFKGSGKVIYSDSRTQIIELSNGTRIVLNQ